MIGGVFLVLLLLVAIVLGGLSGIGTNSTSKFGITTIVLSVLIVYWATHYVASSGLQPPQFERMSSLLTFLGVPIAIAAICLITGAVRRRYSRKRGQEI
jgi:hypothetical protein